MSERVDLGPCSGLHHDGDPGRCAVLLPGMVYPTRAPVLWFARETALAHGWSALEVLGEPGDHEDPIEWQRTAAEAALAASGSAQVLVIGKSLATLLAGHVSDLDLPAVWLTPALTEPAVSEGLARARRTTIVMGGTADDFWRPDAIPPNPALEVVELPGLDHALQLPGDPLASVDALRQVVEAVGRMMPPPRGSAATRVIVSSTLSKREVQPAASAMTGPARTPVSVQLCPRSPLWMMRPSAIPTMSSASLAAKA